MSTRPRVITKESQPAPLHNQRKRHRLILVNDGGTLVGPTLEAPMGAEGLIRLTIEPLMETQIDTLYWQLGTETWQGGWPTPRFSDTYSHRTKVGPRWGSKQEKFGSAGNWRIYENTRQLMEQGTDPPAVVIENGHKRGLEVFLSIRVNDIHDGIPRQDNPTLSPIKRQHRDWLLGAPEGPNPGFFVPGMSRYAYNFLIPEVRDYKLALAEETIANYDLDGLDWDFYRWPRLFPKGRQKEVKELLTDLIRRVRAALDRKSKKTGRKLYFSVRVPPTFELALAFGIDVKKWLEEGLIDILIAGAVHGMQRLPVEEYIEATRGTDVQVIANIDMNPNGLGYPRLHHHGYVFWPDRGYYTNEMYRAVAANYWQAGVDGIYLWNNHLIKFGRNIYFERTPWKQIADPDLIARKNKHYIVDRPIDWQEWASEAEAPLTPEGPLPVSLTKTDDTAEIPIDIADDLLSASQDDLLDEVILRVMIYNLTALDTLEFTLNDTVLDVASARKRLLYNECWIDFDAATLLRKGWNHLGVKVKGRNPHLDAPLRVESVEVIVRYKQGV